RALDRRRGGRPRAEARVAPLPPPAPRPRAAAARSAPRARATPPGGPGPPPAGAFLRPAGAGRGGPDGAGWRGATRETPRGLPDARDRTTRPRRPPARRLPRGRGRAGW